MTLITISVTVLVSVTVIGQAVVQDTLPTGTRGFLAFPALVHTTEKHAIRCRGTRFTLTSGCGKVFSTNGGAAGVGCSNALTKIRGVLGQAATVDSGALVIVAPVGNALNLSAPAWLGSSGGGAFGVCATRRAAGRHVTLTAGAEGVWSHCQFPVVSVAFDAVSVTTAVILAWAGEDVRRACGVATCDLGDHQN